MSEELLSKKISRFSIVTSSKMLLVVGYRQTGISYRNSLSGCWRLICWGILRSRCTVTVSLC